LTAVKRACFGPVPVLWNAMTIALDLSLSPARGALRSGRRPLVGLGRPRLRADQPDHARP